jgi:septal ring factor EnvC (AmiA/AmiB activator)
MKKRSLETAARERKKEERKRKREKEKEKKKKKKKENIGALHVRDFHVFSLGFANEGQGLQHESSGLRATATRGPNVGFPCNGKNLHMHGRLKDLLNEFGDRIAFQEKH